MELNQPAVDFSLPDLDGKVHHLSEYRGKIVVVNFWSCECPHSERTDKTMLEVLARWPNVSILWIASNQNETAEALKEIARARGLSPVLRDADSSFANLYEAQTTPHLYIVDENGILRYRGAVDDVTFRQRTLTRSYLKEAVESLLEGHLPPIQESPGYGCTIVREV